MKSDRVGYLPWLHGFPVEMNKQAMLERVDGLLLVGLVLPAEALLVHQVVIFMTKTTNCSHLHKRPFLRHLGRIIQMWGCLLAFLSQKNAEVHLVLGEKVACATASPYLYMLTY